jgi:hypothetical protein
MLEMEALYAPRSRACLSILRELQPSEVWDPTVELPPAAVTGVERVRPRRELPALVDCEDPGATPRELERDVFGAGTAGNDDCCVSPPVGPPLGYGSKGPAAGTSRDGGNKIASGSASPLAISCAPMRGRTSITWPRFTTESWWNPRRARTCISVFRGYWCGQPTGSPHRSVTRRCRSRRGPGWLGASPPRRGASQRARSACSW